MKLTIVKTEYNHDPIRDFPEEFLLLQNPLYVGAREGQVYRVYKMINGYKGQGKIIGAWALGEEGYINPDGSLNLAKFREHDGMFFVDSHRIAPQFQDVYERLIQALKNA